MRDVLRGMRIKVALWLKTIGFSADDTPIMHPGLSKGCPSCRNHFIRYGTIIHLLWHCRMQPLRQHLHEMPTPSIKQDFCSQILVKVLPFRRAMVCKIHSNQSSFQQGMLFCSKYLSDSALTHRNALASAAFSWLCATCSCNRVVGHYSATTKMSEILLLVNRLQNQML